jgi:RNA polymerase sigma-70 factor (ECF subfamily)
VDLPERAAGSSAEQQPNDRRVSSSVDVPTPQVAKAVPMPGSGVDDPDGVVTAAYEAFQRELFSFLARAVRDEAAAEDLLQETFLRLAREVRAGRTPEQVRAWLYRVAANLSTSSFRHRTVARRWFERFGASSRDEDRIPPPEDGYLRGERYREIERAFQVVSTESRTALLLAAQGFSGREIAGQLGKSEVATRALMFRARLRLRAELEGGER